MAVEWFGGRLGLATTRVWVLVLRIATKYNSEFSLSGLHFGRMLTTSYAYLTALLIMIYVILSFLTTGNSCVLFSFLSARTNFISIS